MAASVAELIASSGRSIPTARWCLRREDWGDAWAMDEDGQASEDEAFWRFSLAFYERPGVAEALITLQDRDGFDINLILFALWLGISGHGPLGGDTLAAAERVAAAPKRNCRTV